MTPRERAQARLSRHVPDFGHWDGRDPARRVAEREDAERRTERQVLGASVRVRDGQGSVKRADTVEAGPNAPLLMRLVRTPYRLEPGRSERVRYLDDVDTQADTGPVRVADLVRELRDALRGSRPVRDIDHRPTPRAHPFARVRDREDSMGDP